MSGCGTYENEEGNVCLKTCIIKPEATPLAYLLATELKIILGVEESCGDVLIVVGPEIPNELQGVFEEIRDFDKGFNKVVSLFKTPCLDIPIIWSPLVEVTAYHDVRVYHDAAVLALHRAVMGAFRNPILVVPRCPCLPNGDVITILGALQALYVPLQVREDCPEDHRLVDTLWLLVEDDCIGSHLCKLVSTYEPGRFVYRDLAMADPERITPIRFEDYLYELFKESPILIEIICEPLVFLKEFPLYDAVNRAAHRTVPRHQGRIVLLEYIPKCMPEKTILIVGKGVTFDTGGLSLKISRMCGMSRDKSGAAAAVGFMQIVNLTKPPCIHVIVALPLTRNSIGEQAYATDEIVKSRAGVRVRFNNTDAEGRLIMSDPLTYLKEQIIAKRLPDPHLFTFGTMTHHARISVGDGYPIILDNSTARECDHAYQMQAAGSAIGEPHEISILRKDDFDSNKGKVRGEDLVQTDPCNHRLALRGHQIPAAFLLQSTLLTEHDVSSCLPIKYSHIDMQGNALNYPYIPASQPIITMSRVHLESNPA